METKKDRRVARTQSQLHTALLHLIAQGNAYGQIKIVDIADEASVSRATFYLHYRGKDDLFIATISKKFKELLTPFYGQGLQIIANRSAISRALFEAIKKESALYKILLCHEDTSALQANMQRALTLVFDEAFIAILDKDELAQIKVPHRLLSDYLAGTHITLSKWWLANDMPQSVDYMTDVARRLSLFGIAPFLV